MYIFQTDRQISHSSDLLKLCTIYSILSVPVVEIVWVFIFDHPNAADKVRRTWRHNACPFCLVCIGLVRSHALNKWLNTYSFVRIGPFSITLLWLLQRVGKNPFFSFMKDFFVFYSCCWHVHFHHEDTVNGMEACDVTQLNPIPTKNLFRYISLRVHLNILWQLFAKAIPIHTKDDYSFSPTKMKPGTAAKANVFVLIFWIFIQMST